jgi:Lipocalin-like domain
MLTRFAMVVVSGLLALCPLPVLAQDLAQAMVGAWKLVSLETKEVVSGKVSRPMGDEVTGLFVFTKGGHFSGMVFRGERKAPEGPNATEAERIALFNSLVAYHGTYRTEGNKLIMKIANSHIQSWNGTERVLTVEVNGSRLTGRSAPLRAASTGLEVVAENVWERVE